MKEKLLTGFPPSHNGIVYRNAGKITIAEFLGIEINGENAARIIGLVLLHDVFVIFFN